MAKKSKSEQAASTSKSEATDSTTDGSPFEKAAAVVRKFPTCPGVYLMKNVAGVVIYVGKATNLRSRAGSYFLKAALTDTRTGHWVGEIADADFMECESEVDALLVESRLIKDIQPQYNKIQKDDKTFPYLQISTYEAVSYTHLTLPTKA